MTFAAPAKFRASYLYQDISSHLYEVDIRDPAPLPHDTMNRLTKNLTPTQQSEGKPSLENQLLIIREALQPSDLYDSDDTIRPIKGPSISCSPDAHGVLIELIDHTLSHLQQAKMWAEHQEPETQINAETCAMRTARKLMHNFIESH